MDFGLLILIALVLLSGAFSAAEIALTSLTEAKVRPMEGDNKFASPAILKLKKSPQKLLISILVANQIVNIVATVVATMWALRVFGEGNLSIVTTIFAFLLILFGSISPKTIALSFPEIIARVMAYPLLVFVFVSMPIVWVFELFTKFFLKLLKADKKELTSTTEEEIKAMLDISMEKGIIEEEEDIFMKQILKFSETRVADIMTLFKDIDAIDRNIEREELIKFFQEHDHTHFPVYEEDLNNIKGIVSTHDLINALYHSNKKKPLNKFKLSSPVVVPKTETLTELFKVLKEKHRRMAAVIDEHGQTIGLVTLGDILEEIAGEKIESAKAPEPKVEKCGKNCWEADGEVAISKINDELELDLSHPEHKVISLVVLEELKRFPEVDEKVQINGLEIEIKRVEKNVIKKVILRKKKSKEEKKK